MPSRITIGIAGHGRAGKDTVAELLAGSTSLRYRAGTSYYARHVVFEAMQKAGFGYPDAHAAWLDRHSRRVFWAHTIGEYNRDDPVRLYRDCLAEQDILTGVRWRREKEALDADGLVDLWVWVSRPGNTTDPTMEFTSGECDLTIQNAGTLEELRHKLGRIIAFCDKLRER